MEEYIRILTEQIRCVKAREGVAREIRNHIEDQAESYVMEGMEREAAVKEAVRQMGDPVTAGVELDRIHRPRMDWTLLIMVAVFSIGGLFLMNAVDGMFGGQEAVEGANMFLPEMVRQFLFSGAGLLIMLGICFLDYSFIGKYAGVLYLLFLVGIPVYVYFFVPMINGMYIGAVAVMYLFVPIYAGMLYRLRGQSAWGIVKAVLLFLPGVLMSWYLIPSVVTSFSLLLICGAMLITAVGKGWFAGNRKRIIAALLGIGIVFPVMAGGLTYLFLMADYQKMRIDAWLHPGDYAGGRGYIYQWIRQVLAECRWIGAPEEMQWLNSMGLPSGNYYLLLMVSTFGAAAGLLVLLGLAFLLFHIFRISFRQKNQLGLMIGTGCAAAMLVNTGIGVGVNFGLFPATTVMMPFFSYGGSVTMVYSVLVGLLLSVSRYRDIPLNREKKGVRPGWKLRVSLERTDNSYKI